MAAGDFSASTLGIVKLKMDQMWSTNGVVNSLYQADCETAKVLIGEQTANIGVLEDSQDKDVRVYWVKPEIPTVVDDDGTSDCTIGGDEKQSLTKSYLLSQKKKTGFSVKEKMERTNLISQAELIANGFLTSMKAMDETIAKAAIAKLEAFKGVNLFTKGLGDVDGTETYIDPSRWDANIYAYFNRMKLWNKFNDPFLLHGGNMTEQWFNALFEQLNASDKDGAAKMKTIRQYWDELNIDTVNTDQRSYMVNKGAVAFASQAYYKGEMREYYHGADQKRFSIESNNLPGVFYDVYYNNECTDNDIKHNWSFRSKFDFLLNPTGLSETHTGILALVNGVKPSV